MSRFQSTIVILLVALLGGGWIAFSREQVLQFEGIPDLTEAPLAGYLAPDFSLPTIQGETITLSDLRGRPVVLNFWATWCPPCRAEIPDLQAVHDRYGGSVSILGVDQGETADVIAPFSLELGITYPLLVDADNEVNRTYGIRALPTTIFIDGQGVVREVYSGILNRAILESRIDRLRADEG